MSGDLYRALQHCLSLAQAGVPLEECLARHPKHAEELRPLLRAATDPGPEVMPAAARHRVRQRVMDHWDRTRSPRKTWLPWSAGPARWATAAAVVAALAVLTLGGGIGTVAAAQDATPGAVLYPVKQLREETRLWFTRSPEEKVTIYSRYAQERVREIVMLDHGGRSASADVSRSRLEEHLDAVDRILEEAPAGAPLGESGRLAIIDALESTMTGRGPAAEVPEALAGNPPGAYPCLEHTLRAIRQAREQVRSALEQVGGNLQDSAGSSAGRMDGLCPR